MVQTAQIIGISTATTIRMPTKNRIKDVFLSRLDNFLLLSLFESPTALTDGERLSSHK